MGIIRFRGSGVDRFLQKRVLNERGISVGEILLVIFLISILAIVIAPRFFKVTRTAKWEACATNVANINAIVQLYYIKEDTWPMLDLSDIETNRNYFPEATLPSCPVTSTAAYAIVQNGHYVTGHQRYVDTHP